MSKKRIRAKLNKANTGKEYKILLYLELYPPYWDGDYNWKYGKPRYKIRSYKTWKHTRKTQWKE
jgi:hypothetical protein